MSSSSLDVSTQNFKEIVIDGSFKAPVVVDFWAPWCGPCKMLKPILEKLADEYQGKFILAKVNSDENQELAAQFGVRGIPSVKAVREGKIVDEFSGALPENAVREWLDRLIPSPAEELRLQAHELNRQGDTTAALALLQQAIQLDDNNHEAKLDTAAILVAQGQPQKAKAILDVLPAKIQLEEAVAKLMTQIELAEKSQHLESEDVLIEKISANPDDLQAHVDLANVYINQQQYAKAIDQCFEVIRRDREFQEDIGRKTVIAIFNLLNNEGDIVREYRRKLATLLN
ncbi:MAG: thioredoxin [Gammaproteobacteria bacterium]|jgi:putative thioredoxin|nr:thioredoxin [Gammaproteobacteria bacterium]